MNKTALYSIIAALLIVIGLLFTKVYLNQKAIKNEIAPPEDTYTPNPENGDEMTFASPTEALEQTVTGTIEGSLSYPSEGIPPGITVCAENDTLEQPICTTSTITDKKYTTGIGYSLEVPPGTYFVYATYPSNSYKAYYDKFVTCGLQASCTDHTPIEVTVKSDETTSKIDPNDWYNMQPSM